MIYTFDELQYLFAVWTASAQVTDIVPPYNRAVGEKIGLALLVFASPDTLSPLPDSATGEVWVDLDDREALSLLPYVDPYVRVLDRPVGLIVVLKLFATFLRPLLEKDSETNSSLLPKELRKLRRWSQKQNDDKNTSKT